MATLMGDCDLFRFSAFGLAACISNDFFLVSVWLIYARSLTHVSRLHASFAWFMTLHWVAFSL